MPITIPNSTAEAFFEAVQQLPTSEIERFKQLMAAEPAETEEERAWHEASAQSAARFFEDEKAS